MAGPIAAGMIFQTLSKALLLNGGVMVCVTLFLQWRPDVLIAAFTTETEVIHVGSQFLRIISWNFLAQGIVFTCSGIFQGLGNTRPALLSSVLRILLFAPLALLLAKQRGFTLAEVWYLWVVTVLVRAVFSYALLKRQFRLRLIATLAPKPAMS